MKKGRTNYKAGACVLISFALFLYLFNIWLYVFMGRVGDIWPSIFMVVALSATLICMYIRTRLQKRREHDRRL